VDPKLAVSSQTSVVLKLNTRGHVPVGNTGKKIRFLGNLKVE
jgi:hypothetical protein